MTTLCACGGRDSVAGRFGPAVDNKGDISGAGTSLTMNKNLSTLHNCPAQCHLLSSLLQVKNLQ